MKVTQLLEYFGDFYNDFEQEKATFMLAKLDIDSHMKLSHMSKGTLEKVQLILAMSRNANLYCLDEPIGGVDPATRDYILNTIVSIIVKIHCSYLDTFDRRCGKCSG